MALKDYKDYEFILDEIERLAVLNVSDLMKYYSEHHQDALHMIRTPGGNWLPSTRAATGRFEQIASRGLAGLGKDGLRFDPKKVWGALIEEFGAFLEDPNRRVLTEDNAPEIFEVAVRSVATRHEALTHYIPCAVVAEEVPDHFTIGPATFSLMKRFLEEHSQRLHQRGQKVLGEKGLARFQSLFSEFLWVASITVPKCDIAVSRVRATAGVQAALNLFKLFVGGHRAQYVGHLYGTAPRFKLVDLTSSGNGPFRFSFRTKLQDAIVGDNWFQYLSGFQEWKMANSLLLVDWRSWGESSEPVARFVEALTWHGDAISEPDDNARVVKFWTAIERVVTLREGDPVVPRAATIGMPKNEEYRRWLGYCSKSYSHRSNIVHGTKKYDALQSARIAARAENLSRKVLLGYLGLAGWARSLSALTSEHLGKVFKRIDKISRDAAHGI